MRKAFDSLAKAIHSAIVEIKFAATINCYLYLCAVRLTGLMPPSVCEADFDADSVCGLLVNV